MVRALVVAMVALGGMWSGGARADSSLVVVVDPGHGGAQEGAKGPGGVEKALALQIAQELRTELGHDGVTVLLTREHDSDLHLAERVAYANRKKPNLFVSIHANSMPTRNLRARVSGVETYFLSPNASGTDAASTADRENAEGPSVRAAAGGDTLAFILNDLQRTEAHADSSRLAYAVHQRLVQRTGAVDRGVQQAPFYVLNGLEAPAILVEVGYISHPVEGLKLTSAAYQKTIAQAIADGIRAFVTEVRARDAKHP